LELDNPPTLFLEPRIANDRFYGFLERTWRLQQLDFAHNNGRSHYEITNAAVQGKNIPFTSLLTMGESWHNNHHAFPGSARLGLFAGEWDPGWWLMVALKKCGLVWGIVLPAALPPRAELHAVDAAGDAALARMRTAIRPRSTRTPHLAGSAQHSETSNCEDCPHCA